MSWFWTWQDPVALALAAGLVLVALRARRRGSHGCSHCPLEAAAPGHRAMHAEARAASPPHEVREVEPYEALGAGRSLVLERLTLEVRRPAPPGRR